MGWFVYVGSGIVITLAGLDHAKSTFSNEAEKYWKNFTGENGTTEDNASDAFRHAYVSARFAQLIGVNTTDFLGNIHELVEDLHKKAYQYELKPKSNEMDKYNNHIGAEFGSKNRSLSSENVAKEIKKKIDNGELIIDPNTDSRIQNPDWLDENNQCLAPWIKFDPYRSGKYHLYNPLVLDLDGNGIELTAIKGFSGSLFDHNADGIATATGWVAKNDGLLVLDLNNNGVIDNGRELFGDNTLLANGQNALNGYTALSKFDSNADGKIDASDIAFSLLKVWKDLNQDGISQENELFTLAELGIQSLNLAHQESNQDLGNGNRLTHIGSYTKTDGTVGQMGNTALANNPFYSRYTEQIELTPEQLQSPNLKGSGRLRDLREAAAVSSDLANVLKAYAAAQTKQEQTALLNDLVIKWGNTDPQKSDLSSFTLSSDLILTENEGIALTPSQIAAWHNGLVLENQISKEFESIRHKIAILDAFTGARSETLYFGTEEQARHIIDTVNKTYDSLMSNIYQGLLFQTRLKPYLNELAFHIEQEQFTLSYSGIEAKFKEIFALNPQKAFVDLGEFLATGSLKGWDNGAKLLADFAQYGQEQGQLSQWLSELGDVTTTKLAEQNGNELDNVLYPTGLLGQDVLNGHGGNDTLIIGKSTAIANGGDGSDVYEFHKGFGASTIINHDVSANRYDVIRLHGVQKADISYVRNGDDLIIQVKDEANSITVKNMFAGDTLTQHIDAIAYDGGEIKLAEIKQTLLRGTDGNDVLLGYGDNDVIRAGAGDDRIQSFGGNDIIYAGLGNDRIDAGSGNDTIYLETGNNHAYGGDGDDTLISGSLKDILEGGMGSDTYVFGQHFGQDTVLNFNPHQQDKDILKFTHTRLSDVRIYRHEADLWLMQKDRQSVKVQNFFEAEGKGDYTIQSIEFANGKTLNTEQLRLWVQKATDGDDRLYAYSKGGVLKGESGNDTLIGNIGKDHLIGGWGNDVLHGGKNNDCLEGGIGNDVYRFNKGDGHDHIFDSFGQDTLKFGEGIHQQDLWFSRTGRDLNIDVLGSDDRITIEGWFNAIHSHRHMLMTPNRIESIETADGLSLNTQTVHKRLQEMSDFAAKSDSALSVHEQMRDFAHHLMDNSFIY